MTVQKSAQAFRTISEVAAELDVPQHVLRFWESKFAHVKPMKRGGGRRYYRPEDVDLLRGIRVLLYDDGFTIKGVQKVFRERGVRFVMEAGRPGSERPVLPQNVTKLKPVSYVDDIAEDGSGQVKGEAGALTGRALTAAQQERLRDVLSELLELKSLIQAVRGPETLTRTRTSRAAEANARG